jgi:hypothetical protein
MGKETKAQVVIRGMAKCSGKQIMKERVTFSRINFAEQAEAIERILQAAVQRELSIHKRLGKSNRRLERRQGCYRAA